MTDSATSRAERAPLLASGDEGMRASSSGGGWGRFALGAGTLGVIAACAAVATTPASMDAGLKTLGIGLSLPRAERGGAPRTAHHIRPVMGGALDEPKKVLSASLFDDDEETPALGSHSRRSASKEDDSDRDRQFLVPTTVMGALWGFFSITMNGIGVEGLSADGDSVHSVTMSAVLFWLIFKLLIFMIILNMFLGILIGAYDSAAEEVAENGADSLPVSFEKEIERRYKLWRKHRKAAGGEWLSRPDSPALRTSSAPPHLPRRAPTRLCTRPHRRRDWPRQHHSYVHSCIVSAAGTHIPFELACIGRRSTPFRQQSRADGRPPRRRRRRD